MWPPPGHWWIGSRLMFFSARVRSAWVSRRDPKSLAVSSSRSAWLDRIGKNAFSPDVWSKIDRMKSIENWSDVRIRWNTTCLTKSWWKNRSGCRDTMGKLPQATPNWSNFWSESEATRNEKIIGILNPYRIMTTYELFETITRPFGIIPEHFWRVPPCFLILCKIFAKCSIHLRAPTIM